MFYTIDRTPKNVPPKISRPLPLSTTAAASNVTTTIVYDPDIPDGSIGFPQIQDITANRLLGRSNSGDGPMEEITLGPDFALSGTTLILLATSTFPSSPGNGDLVYYNGTEWATLTPQKNIQTGSTSNTVTLPLTPAPYTTHITDVFINGVLKEEGEDYTISSNTITLAFNLVATDKVTTRYYT